MSTLGCFTCCPGTTKIYHFENFTFANSRLSFFHPHRHKNRDGSHRTKSFATTLFSFPLSTVSNRRREKLQRINRQTSVRQKRERQAKQQAMLEKLGIPRHSERSRSRSRSRGRQPESLNDPHYHDPRQYPSQAYSAPGYVEGSVGSAAGAAQGHNIHSNVASSSASPSYAPPSNPPPLPKHQPPAQPPPQQQDPPPYSDSDAQDPPPYHNWQAIPDTALLPPPPSISYKVSPVANASSSSAARAHAWTDANPLWPPRPVHNDPHLLRSLSIQFSSLIVPRELSGRVAPDPAGRAGVWRFSTAGRCPDACMLSSLPLHSALQTQQQKTMYFEVKLLSLNSRLGDCGVAVGFVAPPYPTWRLPGWERASLGVHGDDGRRFVNDTWGGKDFTSSFKPGNVVGIGVVFSSPSPPEYRETAGGGKMSAGQPGGLPTKYGEIGVFFTRNGVKEGEWDLREEVDADVDQPGGVTGLEGDRDLHAAVGVYGSVEGEVVFGRHNWLFKPGGDAV